MDCSEEERSALVSLLPLKEQEQMQGIPSATLPKKHLQMIDSLHWVHFSWLAPFLRTFGKQDLSLFLAALSKEQSTGLKDLLGFFESLPVSTAFLKEFVRRTLFHQLNKERELIPPPYLQASVLQPLLQLEHRQLMTLLQYLGLYDLSFEMRQIISTAEIKKILTVLHEEEALFIREISNQGNSLVFKRLFLHGWNGKRTSFVSLLQGRGLQRLALALHGQEESFIWSFSHILEMSIAMQLFNLRKDPGDERVSRTLIEQILTVFNRFFQE